MKSRYTKLNSKLKPLPKTAKTWDAVRDNITGLIWAAKTIGEMNHVAAAKACTALSLGGKKGWRLPTVEELFCLADRSRYSPAIDTAFFPDAPTGWHWSASPYAAYSGYAWGVNFSGGLSGGLSRGSDFLVRPVRSAAPARARQS